MEHVYTPFRSLYGEGTFHCFSFGPHEEDNILVIQPLMPDLEFIRVQSACYTAEIFRSTDCDCHEQLDTSLKLIFEKGGLVVYMLCDGRGAGLLPKVRALKMWEEQSIDTHDAYKKMGIEPDPRNYERLKEIFNYFKIVSLRLLTNNPRKVSAIETMGFQVERVSIEVECHSDAIPYLETKRIKFHHMLNKKKSFI